MWERAKLNGDFGQKLAAMLTRPDCAKRNTTRPGVTVHQSNQEGSKLIGERQQSAQINPSGCKVGFVSEARSDHDL